MNSKQRAYLRKISAMEAPIFQVGKSSVTPELTEIGRASCRERV